MFIFKNALKNLTRNKGRNLLIGIITIAILSCTAISVIINTTSDEIIKNYKNRFGSEVFIQPNHEKQNEKLNQGASEDEFNISREVYEKISKSEYLKETIFNARFTGYSNTLRSIDQKDEDESKEQLNVKVIGPNKRNLSENSKLANLMVLGGLSPSGLEEFKNGTRKITDGKMPEKDGEAAVSEEFAKLNNLKVGDKLKIKNPEDPDKIEQLELSVSGIYYDGTKSNNYGISHPMVNRRNEIITTFDTLKLYGDKMTDDIVSIEAKYYLKNPDLLEAFNKEAHDKGLNDLYDVSTDATSYNSIVKPIEGLKKVSNIFMLLVLGFGGSILILISILAIRERKYEIGVLRAMGMKKSKVALGLIFETLFMVGVSLTVGLTIGRLFAQPVSNILLSGQIEAQKAASSGALTMGVGAVDSVTPLEKLNVHLSSEAILTITLIAVVLAVVSVSIGIIYINRYEPRKILSERN